MYNINGQPIHKVKSKIYIASKLENKIDERGHSIPVYDTPKPYFLNVQVINATSEILEFGENTKIMKVISITQKKKYLGKFKEFDLVYIDNKPDNELENGDNADYKIIGVRNQNTSIRIYISKLVNEQK